MNDDTYMIPMRVFCEDCAMGDEWCEYYRQRMVSDDLLPHEACRHFIAEEGAVV
jgi:hypothetical protein